MAIQNRRGADADFDPNKVLPGEFGFTTDGSRKVYAAFAPNDVKEVAFKEDVPTKTSDLANDTGFVTKTVADLINYYTKSETYTQEEINQLVSTIPKFSIQPVPELPTGKISTTTVYLLTTGEESQNLYTEYIYVNGAWEKLGTQKLDLSGYALNTDIPTKLSELINDTEFITAAVDNLVNYYTKKEMEERLYEKANSIISTRTGTVVATTDSAKAKPKIKLYGKTEQDGTEGNQLVDVFTSSGMDSTLSDDGLTVATTSVTGSSYVNLLNANFNTVQLLSGRSYYISFDIKLASGSLEKINDTKLMINSGAVVKNCSKVIVPTLNSSYQRYVAQVTVDSDIECTTLFLQGYNATNAVVEITKFMIAESTYKWEPYTGGEASPNINYPQPLNSHGDGGSIVGKVLSGNLFDKGNSNLVSDTYINSTANALGHASVSKNYSVVLRITPNTKFTIGCSSTSRFRACTATEKISESANASISINGINKDGYDSLTIISGDKDNYLYINLASDETEFLNAIETLIVNVGDVLFDYEPYTEQPFTVLTPNGLPGIPLGQTIPDAIKNSPIHMAGVYWDNATSQYYIGDTVEFESGEYVQRIAEVDNSNWVKSSIASNTTGYRFRIQKSDRLKKAFIPIMCSHFQVKREWTYGAEGTYIATDEADQRIISLRMEENSPFTTTDECIAWMNENDVKTNYVLAEPIITDLTQEELDQYNALLMNYPNTTVVNDAGAYMEVEYVADTKEHIKQNYVAKSEHEALKERVSDIEQVIANL